MSKPPLRLLAAAMAGTGLAFALLGLAEAAYHTGLHLQVMLYAVGLYTLFGALAGALVALPALLWAARTPAAELRLVGSTCGLCSAGLFITASGFFMYRDLWEESPSRAGPLGWAVLLLLVLAAVIVGGLARGLGRKLVTRRPLPLLGALVALAALLLGLSQIPRGDERAEIPGAIGSGSIPPVVIVVADAMRADAVEPYGAPAGTTPGIAAFARDAVRFDQAWSAASWTRPGVASILTGRLPSGHRAMHKSDRLPDDVPTLAERLRGVGYAAVASVTNVNLAPAFGLGRGFDPYHYHAPEPFLGAPGPASRLFVIELYRRFKLAAMPGRREVSSYYAEGETVLAGARPAIETLAATGRPFLAYLHFMEPHDPYFRHPHDGHAVARVENPNPPLEKASEYRALYDGEVRRFDALFGQLVTLLRETGLYDRALVVLTADHGEEFGDHGGFWHGTSLYQELVHVPLLVRFPGGQGAGTVRSEPVSTIDLAPTALRWAGMSVPVELKGRPLSPGPMPPDRVLFAEEDHQGMVLAAVRQGPWKLVRANAGNPRGIPEVQLFNLASDPREKNDLAATEIDRRKALLALLEAGPDAVVPPKRQPGSDKVDIDPAMEEQLKSLGYTE